MRHYTFWYLFFLLMLMSQKIIHDDLYEGEIMMFYILTIRVCILFSTHTHTHLSVTTVRIFLFLKKSNIQDYLFQMSSSKLWQTTWNIKQQQNKTKKKMKKQPQNHFKSSRFARHSHKPAELFRTDFITAMKLPDTESLDDESYWVIKDQWKLDWEKGVQVPVNPDNFNTSIWVACNDQFQLPIDLAQTLRSNPNSQLPTTSTK